MQHQYRKLKKLFLRQSYLDAWEDYQRSIRKASFPQWDYIVLTSSNESQSWAFQEQISKRRAKHVLPKNTKFFVLSDPEGKRIGSGGATLQVLRFLSEQEGLCGDFHSKRILVIHSGGDSKRVPQYSLEGKLFSPVPRELPDGRASTLFDEFLIGMSGVPSRFKDGMLVLSGDVLLLFNALQIDAQFTGAAAISMKASAEVGKNHGVFLNDGSGYVKKFLHKQSVPQLEKAGAINEQNNVDLDTGAVLCDAELCSALFSLISKDGYVEEDKYSQFVNEKTKISFYGDFLYPLAVDSTLEQYYKENPEGEFCEELKRCRTQIWEALRGFKMKLMCLSPAEFIHFGTTKELRRLLTEEIDDYEFLGWSSLVFTNIKKSKGAAHCALIGDEVEVSEQSYVEKSWLKGKTKVLRGSIVSQLELTDVTVPENVVLHGVRLNLSDRRLGNTVRIYGVEDNPKNMLEGQGTFIGEPLNIWMEKNQLKESDLWDGLDHSLWTAKLYCIRSEWEEAVRDALFLHQMSIGEADLLSVEKWKKQKRYSLQETFILGDMSGTDKWMEKLQNHILVERFLEQIQNGEHYITALKNFGEKELSNAQYDILMEYFPRLSFSEKIRVLYAVSRTMKYQSVKFDDKAYDQVEKECFMLIQKELFSKGAISYQHNYTIKQNSVKITLPVRVNWGGGWTDTPPYCNEKGGVVLNAAITLKGKKPIEVEVKKIPEYHIEFASVDFDAFGRIGSVEEIWDCHNPYDSFALHKSALIACGVIPLDKDHAKLEDILKDMGGGIYLSTKVDGVPKGSGLGTSSILAGACVKALGAFFGQAWTEAEVYDIVLNLEQIMSTGGGWQDQVGGLAPGIKYITSKPGMKQNLNVEYVELDKDTKEELQHRFALIYTGQRRLARNLLREVVGNYIGGRKESVEALENMKRLAVLMKFELQQGNIDRFAELLNQHWEISKILDAGSTNTCIEQIFDSCNDLIAGRFIAGAGGGGFLQVILKENVTKEMLHERLQQVFQDSGVDVWECEFI